MQQLSRCFVKLRNKDEKLKDFLSFVKLQTVSELPSNNLG